MFSKPPLQRVNPLAFSSAFVLLEELAGPNSKFRSTGHQNPSERLKPRVVGSASMISEDKTIVMKSLND
jgi:hypothetical protein